MKRNNLVTSKIQPSNPNDVWIDTSKGKASLKINTRGKWESVSSGGGGGTSGGSPIIETTYSELVTQADEGSLVPGQKYRITDFVTEFNSENTTVQSWKNQFDLIVTAIDEYNISQKAEAALHDTSYFTEDNHLDLWEIKYDIWNNYLGVKGLITYMKDENGNEAPFDFKNVKVYNSEIDDYVYVFTHLEYDYGIINDATVYRNDSRKLKYFDSNDNIFYGGYTVAINCFENIEINNTSNSLLVECDNVKVLNSADIFCIYCNNVTVTDSELCYMGLQSDFNIFIYDCTFNSCMNIDFSSYDEETELSHVYLHNNVDGVTIYDVKSQPTFLQLDVYYDPISDSNVFVKTPQSGGGSSIIELTQSELESLALNNQLIPEQEYIITDYHCGNIISSKGTSANKYFNIKCKAFSGNKLYEDAYALVNEDYADYWDFADLSKWKLKVDINSVENKHILADWISNNGFYITYMEDEFYNSAYFDFKNIKMKIGNNYLYAFGGSEDASTRDARDPYETTFHAMHHCSIGYARTSTDMYGLVYRALGNNYISRGSGYCTIGDWCMGCVINVSTVNAGCNFAKIGDMCTDCVLNASTYLYTEIVDGSYEVTANINSNNKFGGTAKTHI